MVTLILATIHAFSKNGSFHPVDLYVGTVVIDLSIITMTIILLA